MASVCLHINKGKGDRPVHKSTMIWGLQISAQGCRSQEAPLLRPRKRVHFAAQNHKTQNVCATWQVRAEIQQKTKGFQPRWRCIPLPKYLSLVLVMLLGITGRGHDFSYWTFKHSLHSLRCASSFLFPLPTTGTLGFWWELEVKHLLKSLGDQRHLIQSNFQATPPVWNVFHLHGDNSENKSEN